MSIEITAAVLRDAEGPFSLEQVELEAPRADEILVKIEATGICHTDIVMKGMVPAPSVLGHEGAGIVEQVGADVKDIQAGDRVVIGYPWCNTCPECDDGHRYRCESNFPLSFSGGRGDGSSPVSQKGERINAAIFQQSSFATHVVAPARSVTKVDKSLPPEVAASLTCAVFTGAGIPINSFNLKQGDHMVVFGLGVVGMSAMLSGRNIGLDPVVCVDINQERLDVAQKLGATHVINAAEEDVVQRVKEILPHGAKHILDTTAVAPVWDQAIECLGQGGEFAFVSVPQPWDTYGLKMMPLMPKMASVKALVQGSSSVEDLVPQLVEWYQAGTFPLDELIKTYSFAEINAAFDDMTNQKVIKPVLLMEK